MRMEARIPAMTRDRDANVVRTETRKHTHTGSFSIFFW